MSFPQLDSAEHRGRRGWVQTHSATLVELFRIVDIAWIFAGLFCALGQLEIPWDNIHFGLSLLAAALFTIFAGLWPLYRSWRVAPLRSELYRAGLCWLATVAGVSLFSIMLDPPSGGYSGIIPTWGLATGLGLLGTRAIVRIFLRVLRQRGRNFRNAAIIGHNETGKRIEQLIRHTSWMGLNFVGFYDDREVEEGRSAPVARADGNFDDLLGRIQALEVDIVYITLPLRAELRITEMLSRLHDSTVTVYYVPDFTAFGLLRPHWENLGGTLLLSLIDTPHQGVNAISKRLFDIIVASLILSLIALPMLVIAIAIKFTSKGPVIFSQKRYGLEGRAFEIWKFRTMTVCEDGKDRFTQATKNDSRITPLGAFLRRTSLDELPQFINVLQGRMSIVGPRPHPVALNESQRKHIDGYMLRHKVKPGITGWAQINGYRGETDTSEKMVGRIQYDLEYINNWSISLDVRIIAMTLSKVLADPNAY